MEKIRGASIELDWGFMIFFFFFKPNPNFSRSKIFQPIPVHGGF